MLQPVQSEETIVSPSSLPRKPFSVNLERLQRAIHECWHGKELIDTICQYALVPAGKLFRPILLLEACAAVGGDVGVEQIIPAAIGAESGHIASLIHDDIIDSDDCRRGRMSVHRQYGIAQAIVSGDALIFYLFLSLSECQDRHVPPARIVEALRAVAAAGIDVCRGQSRESELSGDLSCTSDTYIGMVQLKTGAFFRGACECGAILAGGSPEQVAALAGYGNDLGIAYQIHDDMLAYTSTTEVMGKAATSDVKNRRLTLPVILAYQGTNEVMRAEIERVFTIPMRDVEALAVMRDVLQRTSALAETRAWAERYARSARDRLHVLPESASRDVLIDIAYLAINRDA
jgi:geranylgeranyl pyrophosphate synthase